MHVERNIILVDDDAVICNAITRFLETHGYLVRTYSSVKMLLEDIENLTGGVLLQEFQISGISGLELQMELKYRGITFPTIYITKHGDVKSSVIAMKAGAIDFLEKPLNNELLLKSIEEAFTQSDNSPKTVENTTRLDKRYASLTNREKEVIHHILSGMTNKEIAEHLGISRRTVEVHRHSIMKKMKAESLPDLVRKSDLCSRIESSYIPGSGAATPSISSITN